MGTKRIPIYEVERGNVVCSMYCPRRRRWVREWVDADGVVVNIHKRVVERSLNGCRSWILCVYKTDENVYHERAVFHVHLDTKVNIYDT